MLIHIIKLFKNFNNIIILIHYFKHRKNEIKTLLQQLLDVERRLKDAENTLKIVDHLLNILLK